MTPKTLSQAIKQDYVITNILYAGSKKCRVDLKPRFYHAGLKAIISYWINSAYVRRVYPNSFQKFNY